MNPRTLHRRANSEDGFVLIGVVVIVLALTILGISLFGLSGYEAQFMGASANSSRAFYAAEGGIDRARLALSASSDLSMAGSNLPPGVIYTRAKQGDDSTGTLDWADTTRIDILVTAEINGIRRTIEASFRPNRDRTLYRDLIATTQNIYIRDDGGTIKRGNVVLNGILRHNGATNAWEAPAVQGSATDEVGGVPSPQVASYLSSWLPTASGPPSYTPGGRDLYVFNVPDDGYAHFVNGMPGPGTSSGGGVYGLYNVTREVELRIVGRGTAIWMLPNGGRFDQRVEVTGNSDATLVIVSGAAADTSEFFRTGASVGLWFSGGIQSIQIPLILVSDAAVHIYHENQPYETNYVNYLSVFARGFLLERRTTGAGTQTIHLNHPEGQDNQVLNPLYDDGLLPNTLPGRGQDFIAIAGSWREIPQ